MQLRKKENSIKAKVAVVISHTNNVNIVLTLLILLCFIHIYFLKHINKIYIFVLLLVKIYVSTAIKTVIDTSLLYN